METQCKECDHGPPAYAVLDRGTAQTIGEIEDLSETFRLRHDKESIDTPSAAKVFERHYAPSKTA